MKDRHRSKSPKVTAQHSREQQERIARMQAFIEKDEAEREEIAAAYRRGDTETAIQLSVARFTRNSIRNAAGRSE